MSARRHETHREAFRRLRGDRDALLAWMRAHPIAGGAPDDDSRLYPEIPSDLGDLSDDQIEQLLGEVVPLIERVASLDRDLVDGIDGAEIVRQTEEAVDGVERLRAAQETRQAAAAEFEDRLAELAGRVAPAAEVETDDEPVETDDEPETEPVAEETDPVDEPAAEPIAAAARRPRPARNRRHVPDAAPASVITASTEGPRGNPGTRLRGMGDVAELMVHRYEAMGRGADGDKIFVARITQPRDEKLTLRRTGGSVNEDVLLSNQRKIDGVVNKQAIVAAGGICVMPTPRYDVQTFGVTDEPVRDSVPSFNADRGGIAWYPPVSFSEVSSALGVITNQEALSGGSNALKTCQTITCPPTQTAVVDSRYKCVEINNLEARTFPERVEAFLRNVEVARAQLAESDALAEIDAATIAIAGGPTFGAINDIIGILGIQAVSVRSQFRLGSDYRMRAIIPNWLPDFMLMDMYRQGFDPARYNMTRESMVGMINKLGINVTETLDSQLVVQTGGGATVAWPPTDVIRLFPEGAYLRLDSGTLDLGLVRDSTLNQRNAYQIFAETFEKIVYVGLAGMSRKITVTTRPTGVTGINTSATVASPTY